MDTSDRPRRRFAGPRTGAALTAGMTAVADVLLSAPPERAAVPAEREVDRGSNSAPPTAPVPEGLYVLVPAGVDPAERREAVLAAAHRLAPLQRPAAVLLLEDGHVEAHILGEVAAGRLGPENRLGASDLGRTFIELVGQCAQIAVVPLAESNGALATLGSAAERPVFLVQPDDESVVEAYRTLKAWRLDRGRTHPAVLFAGADGRTAVLHGRLRRAAQAFLGCDVAVQQVARPGGAGHEPPMQRVRVFADVPAEAVWPALLGALGACAPEPAQGAARPVRAAPDALAAPEPCAPCEPAAEAAGHVPPTWDVPRASNVTGCSRSRLEQVGSNGAPSAATDVAGGQAVCPAFTLWEPEDRGALLSAIAAQLPGLVGGSLRQVFRVDVDEPGAPPLAAVRGDGALVAILVVEPGQAVDTQAAERWMAVHRSLLAPVCRATGGEVGSAVASIVLAPVDRAERPDGVQRLVPVRLGGHKGIVLLP